MIHIGCIGTLICVNWNGSSGSEAIKERNWGILPQLYSVFPVWSAILAYSNVNPQCNCHFISCLEKSCFFLGIIKDPSANKNNGWCKHRKSSWKKGPASSYQVHGVDLNIDERIGNKSSVCFDNDSLTVICDNSANVQSSTIKVASFEILKLMHRYKLLP